MRLYEITNEYQLLLDQSINPDTGEVNETALACLENIVDDVKSKSIAVASYIKNIEADEIAIDAAISRMQDRKNQITKKVESLVTYLQTNMERCGINEISCPYFVIKLKKCPVSVDVIDEASIPDNYKKKKEVISIDKLKIKEELNNGVVIPGVTLKQNMRLDIR